MRRALILLSLVTATAVAADRRAVAKPYVDPDGYFTMDVPGGWKVVHSEDDNGKHTLFTSEKGIGTIEFLVIPLPPLAASPDDLRARLLAELSRPYFTGWLGGFKGQVKNVKAEKVKKIKVDGKDALRLSVSYERGDASDPRKGHATFLLGKSATFFFALTGTRDGYGPTEKILSTFAITPGR